MITTPDGVSLYTQEDYDQLQARVNEQFQVGVDYATRSVSNDLRDKAITWFKGEVRSGAMMKEDAEGIFNGLAEALGWKQVNSLSTTFTVCVEYKGYTVAEFSGVEADDEEAAIEEVRDNMEVEDVSIELLLSYNGDECRESVNTTWDFDSDEFEFSATEQD